MFARQRTVFTPIEYLALEAASDSRHEYVNGDIVAMSGGSPRHSIIAANLITDISNLLRPRGCTVFTSDMRVYTPSGMYAYPDLSAVCGPPAYTPSPGQQSLLNPQLIIEVLSPSTETFDRVEKFAHYRSIPTLAAFVFVAQDAPKADVWLRQADDAWKVVYLEGPELEIVIPALDIRLSGAQVYANTESA